MTQKLKKHFLWPQARRHDFLKSVLLSLLLVFGIQTALASSVENFDDYRTTVFQSSVSGTVTDDTGAPLPGASIVEKGTTNGTQTDFDGNYTINVDSGATLVISYIGYATQEIPVNGQATINITLQEDASQLDEVILVGYGTSSRAAVTNAVSSVDSEDLVETPAVNVSQALQGRAAGVQVTNAGAPGTNPEVTIRGLGTFGNNQPLFVVDGVPTGNLNGIPAESIESVDILKDASSAAIYGSRGSNGVVIIKTKRGKAGKPKVTFNTYAGLATIQNTLDVMNAQQYRQYAQEAFDFDDETPGNQLWPGLEEGNFDPSVDTDWQDEILRSGLIQNYDLQVTGGSESVNYSVRGGYLHQEGYVIENDFERFSFGASTSIKLSDKINVGQTLNIAITESNNEGFVTNGNPYINALRFSPLRPVFDEETNFFSELTTDFNGQDATNPVRELRNGTRVNTGTSIIGSVFLNYELIPGLTYNLTVGLDHSFSNFDQFDGFIPTGSRRRFEALTDKDRRKTLSTVVTNTLNYKKVFNDRHSLDILAGYEQNKTDFDEVQTGSANALTEEVEQLNQADTRELNSRNTENNLHSVFGRVSYDFDKTYLLSATLRADGSSRFSPQNRWGYFPSVSAGINFANMPFLENNETISALKLRGSWGVTGNNNIGDYLFSSGLDTQFNYVIDGELVAGARPERLVSDDLQWEEITSINIGADVGFVNNAVTLSLEYYQNESDGLLVDVPLPSSAGDIRGTLTQNVGGTETSGFEATLSYADTEGDFTWGANLNMATINAEVTSLGTATAIPNGNFFQQDHNILTVGEAPFSFFGLVTDGIFQNQAEVDAHATQNQAEPGNIRYIDTNGDGTVNADDRVIIGNPTPDFTMNLDFNLNYKNFDFAVFLNGVYGNEIYNGLRYNLEQQARLFNLSTVVLDRWTPTNPSNSVPKATPAFTGNELVSDRFIEDGSFTRIRNITLGYTLGQNALQNFANGTLSKIRFYVSGQNLFTFTDYSGIDPEIVPGRSGGVINSLGLDRGRYTQPQTVLAGIQVEF